MTRQEELDITSGAALLGKYGGMDTAARRSGEEAARWKGADWLAMLDESFFDSSDSDDDDSDSEDEEEDSSDEEEEEEEDMEEDEDDDEDDDEEEEEKLMEHVDEMQEEADEMHLDSEEDEGAVSLEEDDDIDSQASDSTGLQEPSLSGLSDILMARSVDGEDWACDDSVAQLESSIAGLTNLILARHEDDSRVSVAMESAWDSGLESLFTLDDETIFTSISSPKIILEGLPGALNPKRDSESGDNFDIQDVLRNLNKRASELGLREEDVMLLVDRLISEREAIAGMGADQPEPDAPNQGSAHNKDIKVYRSARRDRSGRRERSSRHGRDRSRSGRSRSGRSRSGRSRSGRSKSGRSRCGRSKSRSLRKRNLAAKEEQQEEAKAVEATPQHVADPEAKERQSKDVFVPEAKPELSDSDGDEIAWDPALAKQSDQGSIKTSPVITMQSLLSGRSVGPEDKGCQEVTLDVALAPPVQLEAAPSEEEQAAVKVEPVLQSPPEPAEEESKPVSKSQQQRDHLTASFFDGRAMPVKPQPKKPKGLFRKMFGGLKKKVKKWSTTTPKDKKNSLLHVGVNTTVMRASVTDTTVDGTQCSEDAYSRQGDSLSVSTASRLAVVPEVQTIEIVGSSNCC